jgi:serine/threonine protein kinase
MIPACVRAAATDASPMRTVPSPTLPPGGALGPDRHVLRFLGGGERYEAYVAWDERRFAPVVAKVLRPHLLDDAHARAALIREASALDRIAHPAIVRSFGAVLDGPHPHLVLEFLDGPRLSTLIRRFGPLAVEQLVPLTRQLSSALAYMNAEGWTHLDVKPRNIIMTGAPKLIDLSIARPIDDARRLRAPVGTDAYMAPEQCAPDRHGQIGATTDVFGLAATVYEALTGRVAFANIAEERFPQLRPDRPAMPDKAPPGFAEILVRCLADEPADRPTPAELFDLLEPLAGWADRGIRRIR